MTTARLFADRAQRWAADDSAVRGLVVFGSVARGTDHQWSDLDLVVVSEPGCRDELWDRRAAMTRVVLGQEPVFVQEPNWQRPYRYQAWDDNGHELDLTFDEGAVAVFGGIAKGFDVLLDRGWVSDQLTADAAAWTSPEYDAASLDDGTWVWFLYLHAKLQHGERFAVRAGLSETLANRVVPMLGGEWHSAESDLDAEDMDRVHAAIPTSSEPAELTRALQDTATVYEWALDRWADRTGNARPHSPLAAITHSRLAEPNRQPDIG